MFRRAPGSLFIAACVAALALRLLVPAGWMPVAKSDSIAISLCSGGSLPTAPSSDNDGDRPCSFALSFGPWLAAAALVLPILLLQPLQLSQWHAAPIAPRRRPRVRPPGQGPPRS